MKPHHRIQPGPGQESVWDYPRPPRVEASHKHIQVLCNGITIADTHRAKRVLETSHPPVYYIPPEDIKADHTYQNRPRYMPLLESTASSFPSNRPGQSRNIALYA